MRYVVIILKIMSHNKALIKTNNLTREFSIRTKAAGLKASLSNFIFPKYNVVKAVNNLDIEVQQGEIIGFLGPNGAGKTTTLKMMAGLLFPTSGSIEILGHNPFDRDYDFLKSISLVMGQKQNLWWDLPPIETFAIHKEIYSIPDIDYKKRLDELIEMLEISNCLETQARKLSLGQRMRCELAVSLIHQPKILFLDEPTIGLDIVMQKKVRRFLKEYHTRFNTTVLLTSHYMEDVAALANRVIVIDQGEKVFDGDLDKLSERINPFKYISVIFNEAPSTEVIKSIGEPIVESELKLKFKVERSKVAQIASVLFSKCKIDDLTIENQPLEDIISSLFTRDENK